MKLALHRSLTFWAGLLVMGFVGWGWWNSERFTVDAQYGRAKWSHGLSGMTIEHANYSDTGIVGGPGRAEHVQVDFFPPPHFFKGPGSATPLELEGSGPWPLREHVRSMLEGNYPPECWRLFIPHWLILLTVAAVWLCLLFGRARRRKRATPRVLPSTDP